MHKVWAKLYGKKNLQSLSIKSSSYTLVRVEQGLKENLFEELESKKEM